MVGRPGRAEGRTGAVREKIDFARCPRWWVWVFAVASLAGAEPGLAQLSDEGTISTEGTQFVRPDPPKPPEQPEPPRQPALPKIERPRLAPATPPPTRKVRQPPPRFPSVVILLDTSDSMLNQVLGQPHNRLAEAKEALIGVVRGMSRETRVQMWLFNSRLKPLVVGREPPGTFVAVGSRGVRERLVGKISAIRTGGGTNLYQAVIKTLNIFAAPRDQQAYRTGQRFPVLVVISDGEDAGKTGHTVQSVLAARRKFPLVTINTVGFHIEGEERWFRQLCLIATSKKGCAAANNKARLREILESFYRPRK